MGQWACCENTDVLYTDLLIVINMIVRTFPDYSLFTEETASEITECTLSPVDR